MGALKIHHTLFVNPLAKAHQKVPEKKKCPFSKTALSSTMIRHDFMDCKKKKKNLKIIVLYIED